MGNLRRECYEQHVAPGFVEGVKLREAFRYAFAMRGSKLICLSKTLRNELCASKNLIFPDCPIRFPINYYTWRYLGDDGDRGGAIANEELIFYQ
jgi:hypothetical protein